MNLRVKHHFIAHSTKKPRMPICNNLADRYIMSSSSCCSINWKIFIKCAAVGKEGVWIDCFLPDRCARTVPKFGRWGNHCRGARKMHRPNEQNGTNFLCSAIWMNSASASTAALKAIVLSQTKPNSQSVFITGSQVGKLSFQIFRLKLHSLV